MNNNFVDLSCLPKRGNGNYNWEESIGKHFPFYYNGLVGEILVLNYDKKKCKMNVFVENYTPSCGREIYANQLIHCTLGKLLSIKFGLAYPELIVYLKNKDDAHRYSAQSACSVVTACPFCGEEKIYKVHDLTYYGFRCDKCGDGVSYPNKFMRRLLMQLGIDFIPELSKKYVGFEWVKNYRYDFYFKYNNKEYFIEMDGGFHYIDAFNTINKVRVSDYSKDQLAAQHNIYVIRIDCNYKDIKNRFLYIKNNICNSELACLFNLNYVDWSMCNEYAVNSLVKTTCFLWENGMNNSKDIAKYLHLSPCTVRNYLHIGGELGLVDYDGKKISAMATSERNKSQNVKRSKPIALYKNNKLIGVFRSCDILSKCSLQLFGRTFIKTMIWRACKNDIPKAYDYIMRYISINDYNKYTTSNFILFDGGDSYAIAS